MSAPEVTSFSQLALSAPVQKAIAVVGYEQPSPIQAASIPHLLNGEDLLGVAQTGTGKTAAFALPLLSRIDLSNNNPQVLVLAPTRELAIQVAEAFQTYASQMKGFHVLPVYGGQDMGGQLRQLKRGVHVVVGTPGRIMDHLRRQSLNLQHLTSLVLDEADEMLRMGFIDDVQWILEHTPSERQVALFSATMPREIRKVADRYLRNPKEVSIVSETTTAARIEQHYLIVNGFDRKLDAVTRILEAQPFDALLMFVRTKNATVELAEKLEARGYAAAALNGDMNQALRERTVQRLKKGGLDIIVATDVAARGLDVERISHVVNFDIPYDSEAYVHRIGRTGRAGRSGQAILLVAPREKRLLYAIEKATRQPISPMQLPTGSEVADARIEQFKKQLADTLDGRDLTFFIDLLSRYSDETPYSMEELAGALAYLLQKERPLQVRDKPGDSPTARFTPPAQEHGDKRGKTKGLAMQRYRMEVGRRDQVKPGDIVGALANEGGIESQYIGHIRLYDDYSTVDLPEGMPPELHSKLQSVRVCNRPMLLKAAGAADSPEGSKHKPRKDKTGKKKTKAEDSKPRKRKARPSE